MSLTLASKPQVLENCTVLGSRTALFFESLKLCWKTPKNLQNLFCLFLLEIAWKNLWGLFFLRSPENFFENLFFLEHLHLCPWSRAFLSLASRGSVLGRAVLGLGFFLVCPWPLSLCSRLHLCLLVLISQQWAHYWSWLSLFLELARFWILSTRNFV